MHRISKAPSRNGLILTVRQTLLSSGASQRLPTCLALVARRYEHQHHQTHQSPDQTSTSTSQKAGLISRRAQWYRQQWQTNKTGIAIHLGWIGAFVLLWNYALKEYLEPYLPKAIQPPGTSPLHPERFRRFDLASREPFSDSSSLFTLAVHGPKWMKGETNYDEAWAQGAWSVEIKQPQLQIARAYTPLPPLAAEDEAATSLNPTDLRFLIRRERQGEVSGYLHRLPLDSDIEVRGPHVDFQLPPDVQEVVFLAGGTGIATAVQIAYALSKRKATGPVPPRMSILWASRSSDDAYGKDHVPDSRKPSGTILRQLTDMASRGQQKGNLALNSHCFIDEEKSFIGLSELKTTLSSKQHAQGRKIIFLSGPDGFIEYFAGPKVLRNGVEMQGPVGGLLSKCNLNGWIVWKF